MKTAFIRMIAVAVFITSISALAQSEVAKATKNDNPDAANAGTAVANVSPTLDELLAKIDQLQAEVQQLEAKDKKNQEEQKITQDEANKKIQQQDKEWEYSLRGN